MGLEPREARQPSALAQRSPPARVPRRANRRKRTPGGLGASPATCSPAANLGAGGPGGPRRVKRQRVSDETCWRVA
eukprot:4011837-Alexandrium_andersonii.AAC.1